jgi:hypothetical protein
MHAHQALAPVAIVERAAQYPIVVRCSGKTTKSVSFVATNLGRQPVRGFSGIMRVFDLIGNEIVDIGLSDVTPIPVGKSVTVTEKVTIDHGNNLEDFFLSTDNRNLTCVYLPQRVLDKDGYVHYVRAVSPSNR